LQNQEVFYKYITKTLPKSYKESGNQRISIDKLCFLKWEGYLGFQIPIQFSY
jgi:hypothetical protein